MPIRDGLLMEFDSEMANTRKELERIPEEKLDWTPHAKSATMGWLAQHVAFLPGWAAFTMNTESIDVAAIERPPKLTSRQAILELFDKSVADGREAISKATDEQFMMPWSLCMGEKTFFTMPRIAVIRSLCFNHLIHHRAQLGVYLRLNDIPLPPMYGPTADEEYSG